jgi:hypothetical protein
LSRLPAMGMMEVMEVMEVIGGETVRR